MKKVSAIICVFNEEETLKKVITSVSNDPTVNEIIVVNDGSTDDSERLIKELKQHIEFKDFHLKINKGKGNAMALGVENSINEIIVFIDADQTLITPGYIVQMVNPLLKKECSMVLGYSTVRILNQNVNPFKILTGERALYKNDIIPILNKMKESRFGVETLLYLHFNSIGKSIKFIKLHGLKHRNKYKKMTPFNATTSYINESWEIALTAIKHYDLILKSI